MHPKNAVFTELIVKVGGVMGGERPVRGLGYRIFSACQVHSVTVKYKLRYLTSICCHLQGTKEKLEPHGRTFRRSVQTVRKS